MITVSELAITEFKKLIKNYEIPMINNLSDVALDNFVRMCVGMISEYLHIQFYFDDNKDLPEPVVEYYTVVSKLSLEHGEIIVSPNLGFKPEEEPNPDPESDSASGITSEPEPEPESAYIIVEYCNGSWGNVDSITRLIENVDYFVSPQSATITFSTNQLNRMRVVRNNAIRVTYRYGYNINFIPATIINALFKLIYNQAISVRQGDISEGDIASETFNDGYSYSRNFSGGSTKYAEKDIYHGDSNLDDYKFPKAASFNRGVVLRWF